MTESSQETRPRIPGWAKRTLPLLVSGLILYYYFHDQNWEEILKACARARLWLAILAIVIPQLVFWFFETLIVERHFKWFHGPFPFWTFFWVRGGIYILMFINTALGSGGLLLYMQRKAEITWRKLMGIILFRFGLTLWGICILLIPTTLAMHYSGLADKVKINMYAWWGLLIFGVVYMINSWMTWHHGTHFGISRLVVRDRESEFWTAFRLADKRRWFLTWAMALPPFILNLVGFYFLSLAFDVKVPFLEFMVVSPLALLIMDLPIAFAGFGTATLAWVIFFGDYGSQENIAALTLFLPFARSVLRAIIGLISLRPALKDIAGLFRAEDAKGDQAGGRGHGSRKPREGKRG